MTTQQLISQLIATQNRTLAFFELSEADLSKSYAPGKWTVKQLLHHLTDAETVLYDRIRRAISKPNQVIWAFDQDAWCKGLDYENMPLAPNKAIYQAVRVAVIALVEKYYEKAGENPFVHSQTGCRTLRDEMEKIAWHNEHHLKQIEQALG